MSTTPAPLIYVISDRTCISRSEYYFPLVTAAAAVTERRTEKKWDISKSIAETHAFTLRSYNTRVPIRSDREA